MKKIIPIGLILSSLLVFPGCFGDDTSTTIEDKDLSTYQANEFSITVPKEWDIIEPKDFTSKVAKNTVVVFRNNLKNDVFTANINIITNNNDSRKSSLENAKDTINSEKEGIIAYNEISRETITLQNNGDSDESEFIVFEGKKNEEDDIIRYSQTFLSNDDQTYLITGSYKQDEEEKIVEFIQTALKSFELK